MRKLVFLFLICNCFLKAQDSIRFVNGQIIAAKVMEIGETEIKYNRFDNIGGPLYVAEKNEVKSVKYANGSVDVFNAKPKVEKPVVMQNAPNQTPSMKIEINGYRLFYNDRTINERTLFEIIDDCPDPAKRNILEREKKMISVYRNRRSVGTWMLYGGIGVAYFGLIAASEGADAAGVLMFMAGTGVSIPGGFLTVSNKKKRKQKRVELAHIYNGDNYEFK